MKMRVRAGFVRVRVSAGVHTSLGMLVHFQ